MGNLSTVISEFGGTGSVPINMRAYLKYGAYAGWYGGVAQHDNNSAIPSSGTLLLSNFDSPADKDFVSDTYTYGISTYYDPGIPFSQSFNGYCASDPVMAGSGLVYLTACGAAGSRTYVGKSTYGSSGQVAQVNMIGDYDNDGSTGFIIGFNGDQRATGWGGAGSIQAPYYVTIGLNTYYFSASSDPNGYYNSGYTYYSWPGASSGVGGNFTFRVGIY